MRPKQIALPHHQKETVVTHLESLVIIIITKNVIIPLSNFAK